MQGQNDPLAGFTFAPPPGAGPAQSDPLAGFSFAPPPAPAEPAPITAAATGELAPAPAGLSAVFAPGPKLEETVVPSVLNGKAPEVVAPNIMDPDAFPNPWQTTPIEPPKPVDTGSGFFSGLGAGAPAGAKDVGAALTGNAFAPVPDPEISFGPSPAMGEPQRGFWNELGYGMGHNLGGIIAGAGGAAAGGTAVGGPVGTLGGAALGTFLGTAAADLRPNYLHAVQMGMGHDDAVNYAIQRTMVSSGLQSTLGVIPGPIRGAIGQMLWQTVLQPGVGAINRIATPMVMGEPQPTNEELTRGAGQDLAASILFGALHAGLGAGRAQPRPPETEARPPGPPPRAPLQLEPRTIEGDYTVVTPPGELGAPRTEPPPPTGPRAPGLPSETPPPETVVPGQRQEPIPPSMEPAPPVVPPVQAEPPPERTGAITITMPGQPGVPPVVRAEPPPAVIVPPPPAPPVPVAPPAEAPGASPAAPPTTVTTREPEAQPRAETPEAAPDRDAARQQAWDTVQSLQPGDVIHDPMTGDRITVADVIRNKEGEVHGIVITHDNGKNGSLDAKTAGALFLPERPYINAAGERAFEKPATVERAAPEAGAKAPAAEPAAPKITTEPDHLDPTRSVAKNEAGEVVGKGATPEAATADAQKRGNAPYEEAPAARAEPETPAKRPVTKAELEALDKRERDAGNALRRAERDPKTTPERLDTLRQRYEEAADARDNAEGPPSRASYQPGYEPTKPHEQDVAEHQARVDRRVHAEGTDPTPEPSKAGAVFRLDGGGSGSVVRGTDTKGKNWIGTGQVLTRADVLARAAAAQEKTKTAGPTRPVTSEALTKVTTPDRGVKYEPVTWERQVTDPDTGQVLMIGTKADGTLVALQKPIYDALHAAAGKDGEIVAGTGKDDRLFARTVDTHTSRVDYPGVGMPRRLDQDRARVWAKGADKPAAKDLGKPVGRTEPATGPGTRSAQREQLDKLIATRDKLNSKARTPAEQRKFQAVERQIAALEQQIAKTEGTPPAAPRTTEDVAGASDVSARGGRKVPFQGPEPVGRPRNLLDFKFNDGTSVFRSVFEEAGHDPNLAQSYPIDRQVRILAQHQKDLFGFREVRVPGRGGREPTRVELHQAAEAILDTTRAYKDGMAAVGLPYEAASNHGKLALEYVPKGSTNWFGQYVFDGTIKIQSGANAYGHEWTHAIDHMLAERFTNNPAHMNNLLSQYARGSGLNTVDNVQAAFAKLINTLFYQDTALATRRLALEVDAAKVDKQGNPTKQALNAQEQLVKLEGAGSKLRIHSSEFRKLSAQFQPGKADYWASVYEMLARSHEAYLSRKMQQQGLDPRGFVMPDEAYVNMVDRQLSMAYPKEAERHAIFDAWDEVHQAMANEAILSNGKPPGDFADYGASDPHHWPITAPNTRKTDFAKQARAEISRYRNLTFRQFKEGVLGLDPNRPEPLPGHSRATRIADGFRTAVYAYRSMMKVIVARAPPEAQKILQPIMDSVATQPGTGRVIGGTFQERVNDKSNELLGNYANILTNHGYDPRFNDITYEERLMLRHLLTGGGTKMPSPNDPTQTVTIPKKIVDLHGDVRDLLNRTWDEADRAGLNIGYAKSGFFPRIYDRARAAVHPTEFRKAAGELYSLMFDQEVGTPGADPQALWEKWSTLPRESQQLAGQGNAQLPNQMGELNQNLRRQREIEAKPNPTAAEQTELAKLQAEAKQLAIDAHPGLRDFISEVNAADWHANLVGGQLADFDTSSPSGKYLNARQLPPEADEIMARGGFLHMDPHVVLPGYFHSVARRIAQAKLFGPNEELLHEAKAKLDRIDFMNGDDTTKFFTLIRDVTGRANLGGWHRFAQPMHNAAFTAGTLATMERAVWASLTEPMAASMVTGEVTAGFRNIGYWLGHLAGTAGARDRTALAEYLHVVQSPMQDAIMLSRMGSDVSDSIRANRIQSNFFKATWLTQVTNAQRAASVGTSHWFLTKLAQHLLSTETGDRAEIARKNAGRWFRDLGLPDDMHENFAQMLVDLQGQLPTSQLLQNANRSNKYGGMGDAYRLSVQRLVDRMIQNPHKVDRAMLSDVPVIGLAFQLQSFNYSFQKNVINPALAEFFEHTYPQARDTAKARGASPAAARMKGAAALTSAGVNTAAIVASIVGAATLMAIVRQLIFAPDQVKKHQEDGDLWEYFRDLGFARSGLNGVLDPLLQTWNHLKYASDISALVHGATINTYAKNLQEVLMPQWSGEDPNTNTAKFNQAKAGYNLIGVPLTALVLSYLSSLGPVGRAGLALPLQWGTSPDAANRFATWWSGPKGQVRPGGGGGGIPAPPGIPKLPGMPGMPKLGGGGGGETEKKGGPSMWEMGMGLADDLLVPASRYLGPVISQAPLPLKIGAGIAGAGYAAYKSWESNAPFRNNPNPPPKRASQ